MAVGDGGEAVSPPWCDAQVVVWFRDPALPDDDEDKEWPACFVVTAPTEERAIAWAAEVSADFARRSALERIRVSVDVAPWPPGSTPRVRADSPVSDEDIGW